jgi:HlyD family secretion protein
MAAFFIALKKLIHVGTRFAAINRRIKMGMDKIIEKKKWPLKRIIKYGGIALAILIVVIMLLGTRESSLNIKKERITISRVTYGPFQEDIPIIGNVLPIDTRYLDTVEGGVVETIYVEDGTMVKKGDKILTLSNTDLLINIMRSEAEVNRASNDLRATRLSLEQNRLSLESQMAEVDFELQKQKRSFERNKILFNEDLIPREEFENIEAQYEFLIKKRDLTRESHEKDLYFQKEQVSQLEKSLKRMQANLELVKQRQDNLTVKAPIDGLLTSFKAEIGESIPSGERIGKVDVEEGFKVRAEIDEHYLNRIETGKIGTFEFDGRDYSLVVNKIYQEVKDGKFEIDLGFQNTEPGGIKRGQTLHIKLALSETENALMLPRGGFYQTTGGNWVYVVDPSGQFAVKRDIQLNRRNTQFFEIIKGLKKGENVVTSSYENFGNNERLNLK